MLGYGVCARGVDKAAGILPVWIRQAGRERHCICTACRSLVREVRGWTERIRGLPWGTWQVWRRVEVHRVHIHRSGVRTERVPLPVDKAHNTTRLARVYDLQ